MEFPTLRWASSNQESGPSVSQIHPISLYQREFFVDSQAGLGNDLNHIPEQFSPHCHVQGSPKDTELLIAS
jgi:hypothetical protein